MQKRPSPALLLVFLAAAACTKKTSAYCDEERKCDPNSDRPICDVFGTISGTANSCVAAPDVDGGTNPDGSPTTTPDASTCEDCPAGTSLVYPKNGYYTGSVHASASLRPTFKWEPAPAATHYEIQIDDSCQLGEHADCTFPSPEVHSDNVPTTSFQPELALPVSLSIPVGQTYFWRVRSCSAAGCSSFSPVRYLHVGRQKADFNGDGYADFLIPAAELTVQDSVEQGTVFLYFGKTNWPTASVEKADTRIRHPLAQDGARFGRTTVSIGDLNGDGFGDFAIGAGRQSNPEALEGGAFVYYGRPNWPETLNGASVTFDNPIDEGDASFGTAITADDFNGDGYVDLAIGAPYANGSSSNTGRLYLYWGSKNPATEVNSADLELAAKEDQARALFSGVISGDVAGLSSGDVNGDGFADLFVSATNYSSPEKDEGAVFGFLGKATWPAVAPSPDLVFDNPDDEASAHFQSTAICDLDSDGLEDVVVGAFAFKAGIGRAYAYRGRKDWPATIEASDKVVDNPSQTKGLFASTFTCSPGHLGNPMHLFISAPVHTQEVREEGRVYTYVGWAGLDAEPTALFDDPKSPIEGRYGHGLHIPGDVDGDGRDDLLIGGWDQAAVSLFFGRGTLPALIETPDVSLMLPEGDVGGFFGNHL